MIFCLKAKVSTHMKMQKPEAGDIPQVFAPVIPYELFGLTSVR